MLLKNIYQNNKLIFIHNNKEIIFMNKYNIPIYVMFHHSLCHHDRMIKIWSYTTHIHRIEENKRNLIVFQQKYTTDRIEKKENNI